MATCRACGGILGRDCFNEADCLQISANNEYYNNYQIDELSNCLSILTYTLEQKGIPIPNFNVVEKPLIMIPIYGCENREFDNLPF